MTTVADPAVEAGEGRNTVHFSSAAQPRAWECTLNASVTMPTDGPAPKPVKPFGSRTSPRACPQKTKDHQPHEVSPPAKFASRLKI